MKLIPLPAFQDNDLWLLHDGRRSPAVGPGDAQPVPARWQRDGLQQEAILVLRRREHFGARARGGSAWIAATHQYISGDLKFARPLEPINNGGKRINPFLRTRLAGVAQAAHAHDGVTPPG